MNSTSHEMLQAFLERTNHFSL